MASLPATFLLLLLAFSVSISATLCATVVEDLTNLKPPPDFNNTIMNNCANDPSLKYCNSSPMDLNEIFKSTIVASHLCNESRNPNCVESFPKVDLRNRPKIAPLYLSYDFFWKYCPLSILSIDLANNSLMGSFPMDILTCSQIQALDLSFNDLTGDLPIESFTALKNLTFLNLSYNKFSESKILDSQYFKRFNLSSFLHSGLLPSHRNYAMKAIFLLIGFPMLVILMVCCLGWLCFKRPDYLPRVLRKKHKFTPSMLKAATCRFSRNNLVFKNEGMQIYRGRLRDGTEVRIEIYWGRISKEKSQKFIRECRVLVQLCHKNLIQVLGWCSDRKLRAIITEWTDGQSVQMWLQESSPPWKLRLQVLMGVLEGMCYLKRQWPEVGYDLRTHSILLSDDLEPMISRFKVGDQNTSNRKIYKLGVFLLEIIVNRRTKEEFEKDEVGFIEHIRMNYHGNVSNVIDSRMKLSEDMLDQAKHGVELGLLCTDQSTAKHPSLNQIYDMIRHVYESCLVLASQNHRKSRGNVGKGHKQIQSS